MPEPAYNSVDPSADRIDTVEQLDERLSRPDPALAAALRTVSGDLLILGAGGKMGPTLARLARRTFDVSGMEERRVIAVSRFSDSALRRTLEGNGIQTIPCDLLQRDALAGLPDAPNVVFMAGRKFGASGNLPLTWALNTHMPALVFERFRRSRIVVLSTGNVYSMSPVASKGAREHDTPGPVGEYAQSCLGRERMAQHFSALHRTPATIVRLNYAIDLRYGVLLDIGTAVRDGVPIDLRMGFVNIIWQRDANAAVLHALTMCSSPPEILNVTGQDVLAVRDIATRFGREFGREPVFAGEEADTALLSDASIFHSRFPFPKADVDTMIRWTTRWLRNGGATFGKPTRYDIRDGTF